jgi:predicted acetyltransferase
VEIRTIDQNWRYRREIVVENEPIAGLTIYDYQIRIGSATVRMAGIGDVYTDHEHRMKGHARRLLEDTVAYMVDQGYDVSMLFGIRNLYSKFGYTVCLPRYRIKVKTRDAEEAQGQTDIRVAHPIRPEQMASVVELYNRDNANRTCSVVRTPEEFIEFRRGSWRVPADHLSITSSDGQFLAYLFFDESREAVNVTELASADDRLYPSLLYESAQMAIERRCENITFYLPPDHPFAEYAQRYGCECTVEMAKDGGGMMRVINQETLMRKIQPELQRRLDRSRAQIHDTLAIETDIGTTVLVVENETISVSTGGESRNRIELSQDRLMQLVCGHRSARDVLNDPEVATTGDVLPLLAALFPKSTPYIWEADHF